MFYYDFDQIVVLFSNINIESKPNSKCEAIEKLRHSKWIESINSELNCESNGISRVRFIVDREITVQHRLCLITETHRSQSSSIYVLDAFPQAYQTAKLYSSISEESVSEGKEQKLIQTN